MAKKVIVTEEQWTQLRLEYISSTEVSMRGLQKKYGIPFNQIRNRVEQEKWQEQREALKTESTQKSITIMADINAEKCTRAFRLADKVMDKLEEVVEKIDAEDEYAVKKLKDVTGAIKNMKEIGLFRSSLDQAEQEARIKKLQKDAEDEETDVTIEVVFEGDLDEYAN